MRFVNRYECLPWFEGRTVAIVGSGPGVLNNSSGMIDRADVVVRVNNYKLSDAAGYRTDVFYSFFGTSIKKTSQDLKKDGVKLCMCKLPDAKVFESEWHRTNNKMIGVDFRPHYERRRNMNFWFCDTYVPTVEEFMVGFNLLGHHMPTTGFAAILDVLSFKPASIFLTGFDFFQSKVHNVDEPWKQKNADDPFKHEPERERAWLQKNIDVYPIHVDRDLEVALREYA
jgi:hypothetical protein